ncbi:MAG: copper amine oxidase N-terminal domain-containing protein [Pelotomaculum sp.]|nr:copper amine oxidase N-terminal domain-containing protein [Pelotomaculum sp.]
MPWLYPAMADQVNVYENRKLVKSVVFKIGVPYYVVNGQMPGVKIDVAPFIHNDRTFVPVRFLGNALGVTDDRITWDTGTQTATLKGAKATLNMTIGKSEVVSNGAAKAIDVAPMLVDPGRTMLPARYVAEGLGYEVDWDEATQTVICWPAGEQKPDVSAAVDYLTRMVQPVQGKTVNGYVIPANTGLYVSTTGYKYSDSIVFSIQLNNGNLQQQYADAESILMQALDADTTAKAIDYAKQVEYAIKNISRDNPIYCPTTTFTAPNGMAVRVGGGGGDSVQFDLWKTN